MKQSLINFIFKFLGSFAYKTQTYSLGGMYSPKKPEFNQRNN